MTEDMMQITNLITTAAFFMFRSLLISLGSRATPCGVTCAAIFAATVFTPPWSYSANSLRDAGGKA